MDTFKKYLLWLCIYSVHGSLVNIDQHDLNKTYYPAKLTTTLTDNKSEETVMPLISNTSIPEVLRRNPVTVLLLQIVRNIFIVTTQLGLAGFGWRLSSGFMAALLSVLFGPNVNLIIPVLTRIGVVVLRWLT